MKLLTVALGLGLTACSLGDEGAGADSGAGGSGAESAAAGDGGGTGQGGSGRIWVEGTATESTDTGSGASDSIAATTGSLMPMGSTSGVGGTEVDCVDLAPSYEVIAHATVDDSNSYASPMLVRELTGDPSWSVGDPMPVRAHEFLNAYSQRIADGLFETDVGDGLHIGADARVHDEIDFEGRRIIELAVTFSSFDASAVAVPDVTFVMDTAASMGGEGIERLHGVLRGAGANISSAPRSVAAFTTSAGGTQVREMSRWRGLDDADALIAASAGVTDDDDLDATLVQALAVARVQADLSAAPGVVVVVTDGTNSLSEQTLGDIAVARSTWPPVRVIGVGVGPARAYVDDLLNDLTDRSGGAYFYAPSSEAAETELDTRFSALTQVAARNVELQLRMPPSMRVVGVAGGNRDDAGGEDGAGQNLGADSTMVFHIYLSSPSSLVCPTLGIQLDWDDPGKGSAHHVFPGNDLVQDVPLYERFEGSPPGEGFRRVEAIVAAADALRGPTKARLAGAVAVLNDFLRSTVPDDSASALCAPLARFCDAPDADCIACPDN